MLLLAISFAYAAARGAPWVPTWRKDFDRLLAMADLKPMEHFVELGCGDARVCVEIARRTGARATGVELSLVQWAAGRIRAKRSGTGARVVLGDAFSFPLRDADVVYLFLMPETYERLRPTLEAQLKPGARVVTYVWPIPGWTPVSEDRRDGSPSIFLYRK